MGSVTPIEREQYVDIKAVCKHLGVSDSTMRKLIRGGLIPVHAVKLGRSRTIWRFLLSEVDEWMKKNQKGELAS